MTNIYRSYVEITYFCWKRLFIRVDIYSEKLQSLAILEGFYFL